MYKTSTKIANTSVFAFFLTAFVASLILANGLVVTVEEGAMIVLGIWFLGTVSLTTGVIATLILCNVTNGE